MISSTEPAAPQAMPSGGGSRNADVEEGAESALPTSSTVEKAGNVQIYDVAGKAVPFKSLYATGSGEHQRVMVIFIRHFFCGVSSILPWHSAQVNNSRYVKNTSRHLLLASHLPRFPKISRSPLWDVAHRA